VTEEDIRLIVALLARFHYAKTDREKWDFQNELWKFGVNLDHPIQKPEEVFDGA
jgi:hypothetical protein